MKRGWRTNPEPQPQPQPTTHQPLNRKPQTAVAAGRNGGGARTLNLSGRLKFTVRRHTFTKDYLFHTAVAAGRNGGGVQGQLGAAAGGVSTERAARAGSRGTVRGTP